MENDSVRSDRTDRSDRRHHRGHREGHAGREERGHRDDRGQRDDRRHNNSNRSGNDGQYGNLRGSGDSRESRGDAQQRYFCRLAAVSPVFNASTGIRQPFEACWSLPGLFLTFFNILGPTRNNLLVELLPCKSPPT